MNPRLEAALARSRDGEPVLPVWWTDASGRCACPKGPSCPSTGKHPLTEHGLLEASLDDGAIGTWYRRWPDANVAVHTIRYPRIDIDCLEAAEALREDVALPQMTEVVLTPSGGLHIVLATPQPVRTKVLHLSDGRPLGELRGEGAYVLVPPSFIGSRQYKQLSPVDVKPLPVEDPMEWLTTVLAEFGFSLKSGGASRAYEALAGAIYEGAGRHNAIVSYAGKVYFDGLSIETLIDTLEVMNQGQCRPPLPHDEVMAIAQHRAKRGAPRAAVHRGDATGPPAGLPEIVVTHARMRDLAAGAWSAIKRRDDGSQRLFLHGNLVAEIHESEDGRASIVHLSRAALRGGLDRCADWTRVTKEGKRPARPPLDVVDDMLAIPNDLPDLRGIVGTPPVAADGSLVVEAGYQTATGLYYRPLGEAVPPVPEVPDATDLQRAKQLICLEWLGDFPFKDDASRANAIGAALTLIVRDHVDSVPLQGFDAPTAGTGKTILVRSVGVIATGADPALRSLPRSEEEVRKVVTAILSEGGPVAVFDNVRHKIASSNLALVLTAPYWSDRLLGTPHNVKLPVRTVFFATGNNLDQDVEATRRTVWIRLDAMTDRPWQRAGYRHADFIGWVKRHKHEVVWALLVLTRHWIAKGKPLWKGLPLGSYESWSAVVGGILETAGIAGFLENREELYRAADAETEEWRAFVSWWWETYGAEAVRSADLLSGARECAPSIFEKARDGASDQALSTRLGKAIRTARDRRYGDLFLRHAGEGGHDKTQRWCLELAPDPLDLAGVDDEVGPSPARPPQENEPVSDSIAGDAGVAGDGSGSDQKTKTEHNICVETADQPPHYPQPPQSDSERHSNGAGDTQGIDVRQPCAGGCGRLVPRSQKCAPCADAAVQGWKNDRDG